MEADPRQLTLLGLEPQGLPARESEGPPSEAPVVEGQGELFADRVVLVREIDAALTGGDFERALELRRICDETYGPAPAGDDAGVVELLAGGLWQRPLADVLRVWSAIDAGLGARPGLRWRIRQGVFARLLETRSPEDVVAASPACLPALVAVIGSGVGVEPDQARPRARRLVRDALLSGRCLSPQDVPDDEPLRRLLDHDLSPPWLACLGVLHRLWPANRLSEADLGAFSGRGAAPAASYDAEPAAAFWECLSVAETPSRPEALLHEARRWMKVLHPELHALYMRRAPPP